jgi:hypothetical protein
MEARGQLHATAALLPGTHWIGDCVGPRVGQDAVTKRKKEPSLPLQGIELRTMVINQNCIHEEIKISLNSGNACYHSFAVFFLEV